MMNKERLLKDCGIRNIGNVHWNLSVPKLYEEALKNGEGEILIASKSSLVSAGGNTHAKWSQ